MFLQYPTEMGTRSRTRFRYVDSAFSCFGWAFAVATARADQDLYAVIS